MERQQFHRELFFQRMQRVGETGRFLENHGDFIAAHAA